MKCITHLIESVSGEVQAALEISRWMREDAELNFFGITLDCLWFDANLYLLGLVWRILLVPTLVCWDFFLIHCFCCGLSSMFGPVFASQTHSPNLEGLIFAAITLWDTRRARVVGEVWLGKWIQNSRKSNWKIHVSRCVCVCVCVSVCVYVYV